MAWKEFSELKPEDKRHENIRQRMIVCQSQMERAISILALSAPNVEFPLDPSTMECLKKTASELVDWVYEKSAEEANKAPIVTDTTNVLPIPTAAQIKVLNKIAAELGKDVESIKSKVLDVAEKDFKIRKYPENSNSVSHFVEKLK